nr:hypothetical protein [Tanacetum cinerariifolium]
MSQMRSEGEELESLFFEVDGSSSDECGDYSVAGNDYEGPSVFDDVQYEEKILKDCFWNSFESTDPICVISFFHYISWYQEPMFLIKMSQMRSEGEESESLFFEVDGSFSDECGDYGVAGNDYEGPSVFDDDQYEEKIVSGDVGK